MKKIAVGVGNEFNLFDEDDVSHIKLFEKNTNIFMNDEYYKLHVGATFEESSKVDDLLDRSGGLEIGAYTVLPEHVEDEPDIKGRINELVENNYNEVVKAIIKKKFSGDYDDSILNQLLEEIDRGDISLISETTERRLNELVYEYEVIDVEDFLEVVNEAIVSSGSNHLPLQSIDTEGDPFFYVIDKKMYPRTATLNHIVSSVEAFYEDVITIEMLPTNVWVGEESLKHIFQEVIDINVLDKSSYDLIQKYLTKNLYDEVKLDPFNSSPVIKNSDEKNQTPEVKPEPSVEQMAVDFDEEYDGITEEEYEELIILNRLDENIYHQSNEDGTVSLFVDRDETIYSSYQKLWETECKESFIDMIAFNLSTVLEYETFSQFPELMDKLNKEYPDINQAYTEENGKKVKGHLFSDSTDLVSLGSDIEWTEPEHFDIFNRFQEIFKGTDFEISKLYVGVPPVGNGNGEERLLVQIGSKEKNEFSISSFDKNDTTIFSEVLMGKVREHESTIGMDKTQKIDHERTPIVVKEIESTRPKMKL